MPPGFLEVAGRVVEVGERPGEPGAVHLVGEADDDRLAELAGAPRPGPDVAVVLALDDGAIALEAARPGVARVGRLPVDERRDAPLPQTVRRSAREGAAADPLAARILAPAVPPRAPQRPGRGCHAHARGDGVHGRHVRAGRVRETERDRGACHDGSSRYRSDGEGRHTGQDQRSEHVSLLGLATACTMPADLPSIHGHRPC